MAEKVAAHLNYDCLSREIVLDASNLYDIPEIAMVKAVYDPPSILERFGQDNVLWLITRVLWSAGSGKIMSSITG